MHISFAIHLFYLSLSILLEVVANIFLKLSEGFTHKKYMVLSFIFILAAFTALRFAIEEIPLSVAYAVWGGIGLVFNAMIGIFLFKEYLRLWAWFGILLILMGVFILKLAHLLSI
jgi:spermidine export protein MdtI